MKKCPRNLIVKSIAVLPFIAAGLAGCGSDSSSSAHDDSGLVSHSDGTESSSSIEESSSSTDGSSSSSVAAVISDPTGDSTDTRDGQTYKFVTIGSQVWMAENLKYRTQKSFCYEEDSSMCDAYGSLYTFDEALKACPKGWHLPSQEDFEELLSFVNGSKVQGPGDYEGAAKLKSTAGWELDAEGNGGGTDDYGFSAVPAGYWWAEAGEFISDGSASFWSSSEIGDDSATMFYLTFSYASLNYTDRNMGVSVRCVKD